MARTKFTTCKLDLETADKLRYLSQILGQPQSQIIKELIDEIFELCGMRFESGARLQFINSHDLLMVKVFGKKIYEPKCTSEDEFRAELSEHGLKGDKT